MESHDTMKDGFMAELAEAATAVFEPSAIFLAYAYGSRISGRPRPESDLDVGYYLSGFPAAEVLTIREEMVLALRLSDRLGTEVDLRNLADATLELRGRVLEEGVRIYCRDNVARVNLERDLLGRYHDYKESFRRMHEISLRQFARCATFFSGAT